MKVPVNLKTVESLTASDLADNPVWQYTNRDGASELLVTSVTRIPVENLSGKLVGSKARLANGSEVWALFGSVDSANPRSNEHLLVISVLRDDRWFHLARYHDFDYAERGPEAMSEFLGLPVEDIFPISFDLRRFVTGSPEGLASTVLSEPSIRLSRAEIIAMAVP